MNRTRKCFYLVSTLLVTAVSGCTGYDRIKYQLESFACRLLEAKYPDVQSWNEYPIVYEPINRGRLTVWSGVTTLPSSQFKCLPDIGGSLNSIVLDLANFSEKLEWTFYDMNKGLTYNGISVNQRENTRYNVTLRSPKSYMQCNKVENIDLIDVVGNISDLRTTCQECDKSILSIINGQIKELIKLKLNEQIIEYLHWHLSELLSNQHSTGPLSFIV